MATKTKTELEAEIRALKQQLEEQKQTEEYDKMANNIRNIYTSFVKAGFTEEQAWEYLITITKMNNNETRF